MRGIICNSKNLKEKQEKWNADKYENREANNLES